MNDLTVPRQSAPLSADAPHTAVRKVSIDVAAMCVLAALVLASWLPRLHGPLDLRWDGGVYYVLGTALAEGKGYRLLNEPGEIEAVQYPPLLPVIIAAHQLVLGTNDPVIVGEWLRVSFFLIYAAYIACSYLLLRKFLPPLYAFLATLVILLNFFTNFLSDLCFAEIPFALATTLFFLSNRKPGRLSAIMAAIFAIAAYLLRTVGIAVLLAWVCESLVNRHYRTTAARAVLSLIPILAWHGYIYSVESSPSYTQPAYAYQRAEYQFYNVSYSKNMSLRDPFTPELGKLSFEELTQRFVRNLGQMPVSLGEGLSAKIWYWRRHIGTMLQPFHNFPGVWRIENYTADIILSVLGGVVLAGIVLLFRQGEVFVPVYLLLVLVAVCLTPWPAQWPRYWSPALPFLALALFRSVLAIGRDSDSRPRWLTPMRSMVGIVIGLIFVVQVFTLSTVYAEQRGQAVYLDRNGRVVSYPLFFYNKEGYRELDAGLDWLMAHARSTDIIAASMPHWVYVRTGLKSIMPPFERDTARMQALLDAVPVTYVVVDASGVNFTRDYTLPLLKDSPDRWARMYTVPPITPTPNSTALEIYRRIDP